MTREQVNDYITRRLAWDEAVKMSPHRCPNFQPKPEHDFIDLDALSGNVSRTLMQP